MVGLLLIAFPQLLFSQSKSATVSLNIVIAQVQSLTINEAQDNVNLMFSSKEDFEKGVKVRESNHLNIFSSGKFVVKVSTHDDFRGNNDVSIPASSVSVSPLISSGTQQVPGLVVGKGVNLQANNPQTIISSLKQGTLTSSFDIEYAANGIRYGELKNGTYSGTVVYTIEAN